ncbi:unnamed protein product [Symbiodinium natans]|uniref:Uncharacterized protein n=1 Tax=Symbiodinium natans TaxID=878477 RepID=A0A812R2A9_9DINO|nr:unnamed protein product [Symbiodinium natans]
MEKSSSEPVLTHEDYAVPCHGIGDTGPAKRVTHGAMSKDDGTFSSRINQIQKAAAKGPGPGKYMGHEDWRLHGGSKFSKKEREGFPPHKNPDPTHYERKDFFQFPCNRSKDCLSQNRRVVFGRVPKGNRRSFLDGAMRHGKEVPAPGHYTSKQVCAHRLNTNPCGVTNWKVESAAAGKVAPDRTLAPNHYTINYNQVTDKQSCYTVPKEKASNFLDKVVKEKWIDVRTKREMPGPGTYKTFDSEAIDKPGPLGWALKGALRASASATCIPAITKSCERAQTDVKISPNPFARVLLGTTAEQWLRWHQVVHTCAIEHVHSNRAFLGIWRDVCT